MAAGFDGSIRIRADLEHSNFDRGLSSMGNSLKKFAGLVASAFAVTKIVSFAKEAVNAASELENAWMGLQSIIDGQGRSFGAAKSFINDYISDGLVPLSNAVTAYKNLAARGYDDEQIQKVLTALKDAAAFGRQSSYSLGEAVTSATEGLKNENSILVDNAGVTKNVAKMWEEYAKSIGTTSNNLTQQQKIQAEVNGILEETKFQTGDAAKVAGTYSGQLAMLSYNFSSLKVAIGQGLMPIAQAILPGINTIISALVKLANIFAQVMQLLFGKVTKTSTGGISAATAAQKEMAASGADAAASADKLAGSTGKAGKAAKKTAKELKGVLADFDELHTLADNSDSGSSGSGGSGSGGGGGIELPTVDTSGTLFDDVEINPELEKWVEDFKRSLEPTIEAVGRLKAQLDRLGHFAWEGLKDFYNSFLVPVGKWTLGEGLPRFINAMADGLAKVDWQKINDALHTLWEALAPFAINVGEGLLWFWENVLVPLGTWILNDAVPVFLELLAAAINLVNAVIDKVKGPAQWLWDNFLQPLASWTGGVIISVLSEFADLIQDIADVLNGDMGLLDFISQLTPLQSLLIAVGTAAGVAAAGLALLTLGGKISTVISTISSLIRSASFATVGFRSLHDMLVTIFGPGSLLAGAAALVSGIVLAVINFFSQLKSGFDPLKELLMVLGTALAALGAVILGAPATVAAAVAAIVATVATLVIVVKEHWDEIVAFLSEAWETIKQTCKDAWEAIKGFFSDAWDFIKGIWESVASWFDTNVVKPVTKFFKDLWNSIKTTWSEVTGWFKSNIIDPLAEFFTNVCETIGSVFEGCWIIIQACWKAVSDWFSQNVIEPVQKKFNEVTDAIQKFFSDTWDKIQDIWDVVASWFTENIIDPVRKKFDEALKAIQGFFSTAWQKIQSVWQSVSNWFSQNIVEPVRRKFNDGLEAIKRFFSDAWTNIKNVWNAAGTWFDSHVATPIKNAFAGVKSFVQSIFNSLIGFVEGLLNGAIRGVNKFLSGFDGVVSKAAGFIGQTWNGTVKLNEVHLPRLANGAVIPPNQQFAAILGDQRSGTNIEAPLATIQQAMRDVLSDLGGAMSDRPIEVVLNLDGRVVARQTVKHINTMTRQAGRSVLAI